MENDSCTNVSFSKEEYILAKENNTVFLPSLKTTYYQHQFHVQDELVILCLSVKEAIQFGPGLGYITTAGLFLSIICILLHLIALCLVPKQRNLPALNLASLCVSLLLLYSTFIVSRSVNPGTTSCVVVAVAIHYNLVASFFWMLIIAFDIFTMTRRTQTKLVALKGVQLWRFIMYSTIGWVTPTIIAGTAVLLDHVIPSSSFSPAYGEHKCWFNNSNALLVFCLSPLIIVMSLNLIFFVWTSYLIHQMRHSIKTPAAHTDFKLHLRLFVIMGLMWITGISAAAIDAEALWYLFVILNTTQGAFIFIGFTCKKKLRQELQNVFKQSTSFRTKNIPTRTENTSTNTQ